MKRVSVTGLVSWLGVCERKYLWGDEWVPPGEYSPLWLGSGVHAALDKYYIPGGGESQARAAYAAWVSSTAHELEMSVSSLYWTSLSQTFWEQVGLGSRMLEHYFVWAADRPLPGEVRDVEKFVSAALPNGVELRGRLDLLLSDGGDLVVVDHKTYSNGTSQDFVDLDQQLTAYAWIVRALYGRAPKSIILNVLLRRAPEPPALLKNGTLSKSKSQSTTFELYRDEIVRRGFAVEDYAEVLSWFRARDGSDFFQRWETTRSGRELDSFELRAVRATDRLAVVLSDQSKAEPTPSFTQCNRCPFRLPCRLYESGDDWEYVLRTQFAPVNAS